MDQVTAKNRARWLAELADAIAEAQVLACRMSAEHGLSNDLLDLLARLDVAHVEVEALRRSGWPACSPELISARYCAGPE